MKLDGLFIEFKSNNTQMYVAFKQSNDQSLSAVTACMSLNFLNVNESKTEEILFGPVAVSGNTYQVLGNLASYVKPLSNIWVLFLILHKLNLVSFS